MTSVVPLSLHSSPGQSWPHHGGSGCKTRGEPGTGHILLSPSAPGPCMMVRRGVGRAERFLLSLHSASDTSRCPSPPHSPLEVAALTPASCPMPLGVQGIRPLWPRDVGQGLAPRRCTDRISCPPLSPHSSLPRTVGLGGVCPCVLPFCSRQDKEFELDKQR